MTFRKSILLLIALTMLAALVACSSSSHTTPPPTIAISATAGTPQSATVGTALATAFSATVTSNGSPAAGVSVTFTAPSAEPNGTFATGGATDTETTNSTGVATTSQAFTAGTMAGTYNVTATTSGASTPATFALTNTSAAAAALAVSSGNNQSATVSAAFANPLAVQVTDSDGNPVATAGISVTFTANTGAAGASAGFSGGTNTDIEVTNASGVATTTQTLTANATSGTFTVTASSGSLTSANFTLTNSTVVAILADGNYVFSLTGQDANGNYYVAGAITIAGGLITGGEQDFADFLNEFPDAINPTGSSIAPSADGNLTITLVTCTRTCPAAPDPLIGPGGNGIETLNGTILPLSTTGRTFITEFDASASGSGELAPQNTTAAAATPANGYAFVLNGYDPHPNGFPEAIGGIINVDGAGTISGTGSIFDVNDGGATSPGQTFGSTSTVSPSDPFGRVTFTLVTTNFSTIVLVGYIVDSSHIRLVETSDAYGGTLGGVAYSQGATNTGKFTAANVAGTYVIGAIGADNSTSGVLQVVTQLSLAAGAVTGFLDYNDLTVSSGTAPATSPDPVSAAAYTLDSAGAGDVTIANLTDTAATVDSNLQLYLDGNGHALAITMDGSDAIAGVGFKQTGSVPFAATSFSGPYALDITGVEIADGSELDGVGPVSATGSAGTVSGTVDLNWFLSSGPTYPATAVTGTFVATGTGASNGVFTGTITGVDADSCILVGTCSVDNFSYYLIDATGDNIAIETDINQLTLGFFLQQ